VQGGGLQIEGDKEALWNVDVAEILKEMGRLDLTTWEVRFADMMDIETFFARFSDRIERETSTGCYGQWRNLVGHWDWWDLGGRFDGYITGEQANNARRTISKLTSGESNGRMILSNLQIALEKHLDQEPLATVEVITDRNVELASTLLVEARADRKHAFPASMILPPGAVEDELRWVDSWPKTGHVKTLESLGLAPDASWAVVVERVYELFKDCWVAAIAYHH
jgi:hypothetical protein